MNNKKSMGIVAVVIIVIVGFVIVKQDNSGSAHSGGNAVQSSTAQLGSGSKTSQNGSNHPDFRSIGTIAKSNKLTLLYSVEPSDNGVTSDSYVDVVAVKGKKAAIYSGLKVSDIIGKNDDQVLKVAKAADKKDYEDIQDKARSNNAEDEDVQKFNQKVLSTPYQEPKFMDYTVTGEGNGGNTALSNETITMSYSNRWNDSDRDKNDPSQLALLKLQFTVSGTPMDDNTTIDGQKFVFLLDSDRSHVMLKTNSFNVVYGVDSSNSSVLNSFSKTNDN